MNKLLWASLVFVSFLSPAMAANDGKTKVVKSAPDRICTKTNGDLDCTPKKLSPRAKNMDQGEPRRMDSEDAMEQAEGEAEAGSEKVTN